MDEQIMAQASSQGILITVGGWAVAIVIALITFVAQIRKGGADETAVVLTKWKELVDAHEKQIEGLRGEMEAMRRRIHELEDTVEAQAKTIRDLTSTLEGERRQAQQQAKSFRNQLRALGKNDVPEERPSGRPNRGK
jgi:septal ring factor EnvC (AmiA/AmiB activator)